MQVAMSNDLRVEFEATQAKMQTSLNQLSAAVDTGVTQKFKDADESLNAKLLEANAKFAAEQKEVRELVDELKKKWELV